MSKMNILEILDCYYPIIDGPINVVKNYSKNINKTENCSLAVPNAPKKSGYVDREEFEVIRCLSFLGFEKYRNAAPMLDRKFKKKIKATDYDIFHAHSPFSMGRFAIRFARKKHIPVVATLHTQYKKDVKRIVHFNWLTNIVLWVLMRVYHRADSVWTVNDASREVLRSYGYRGDIQVVRNGTDLKYPTNVDELIERVNKAHNLYVQKNVFIFVGRVAMYKNLPLLAKSLKILKDKNFDFKMLIVGDGFDFKEYQKMIENLGLSDNVIMTGSIMDRELLQGYYLRSDLFLFPSTFDTSSLVPVEAAAHKLPTLLIKGSYTAENIVDNVNGFLVEENPEKYAERIEQIMANKELLKSVGEECHKSVYRTWETVAEEVKQKYKQVIADYKATHKKYKN